MTKTLFAVLLAGTLMVPHITPALGNDGTVGLGSAPSGSSSPEWRGDLRLPPVPYLETMPWLMYTSRARGPKVDMLLGPQSDTLGPFMMRPTIPATRFSSTQPVTMTTE